MKAITLTQPYASFHPRRPGPLNRGGVVLPCTSHRTTQEERLDTRTKVCPDCAAEGNPDPQPADAFYHIKSPRNANGYRLSAYCKRHTKARNAKSARDAPPGSGIRQSRERARATWRTRNPDKWKAIRRSWARRHTQATAKTYSAWVKANKAKRRTSQQAWYRRRKQRTPEQ